MLVASALSAFLVVAAADAPAAAPAAAAPAVVDNDVAVPSFVDEGVALDSLNVLLQHGREAARIALYIDDADAARRVSLERTLLRALRDRRREDIVSPSLVKATLSATALSSLKGGDGVVPGLAADHVIVGVVSESSSGATLNMRLLFTQSGEVLSTGALALTASQRASTASARDVRTVASDIADVIAESVEARGVDVRQHRLAVTPANAAGAAKEARLDRFVQTELSAALRRRGFLVVERAQIAATLDQLAVQELGSERVAEVGKMLGAQSLVLSGVTDAGASFILTSRAVAVDSGDVLSRRVPARRIGGRCISRSPISRGARVGHAHGPESIVVAGDGERGEQRPGEEGRAHPRPIPRTAHEPHRPCAVHTSAPLAPAPASSHAPPARRSTAATTPCALARHTAAPRPHPCP